jgi:ankyrin repeat protein
MIFATYHHCLSRLMDDRSAQDRAWDAVLRKMLNVKTENAFREIFSLWYDSTWIEEQQFLPLHKIVLGFSDRDLSSELQLSTSTINEPDCKGRTPLAWAAARGDHASVQTLLQYGANANSNCVTGNSPLLRAVCARSPTCISPLLRYGASIHWQSSLGFSALHYAAYYQDDDRYISPLLDFGAAIDTKDNYGWTALACTAERDNAKSAKILVDRGADIESRDEAGWTPLLRSVNCNSHQVLRLLLKHEASCSAVSLTGEGILHFAAARADIDTFAILTEASLRNLEIDAMNDDNLSAAEILTERVSNLSAEGSSFADLFDRLIDSIMDPTYINQKYQVVTDNSTNDTETFVDALDYQTEGAEANNCGNFLPKNMRVKGL